MQVMGAFNPLFRGDLRDDFQDEIDTYETQYPKFLRTTTTDKPEAKAAILAGFSRFVERGDGERFVLDSLKLSNVVAVVDREFGLGFNLTRRAVEDDQHNKLLPAAAKWLAHAYNMTKEYRAAEVLDDFFTGSTFLTFDGLSIGNASHTLVNSSATQSNILSAASQLSYGAVVAMRELAGHLKDHQGDPKPCSPNKIIIANNAANEMRYYEIFGSEKQPYTADNQDNAVKKTMGMPTLVKSVYASEASPNRWWMLDDSMNDAEFAIRRDLTLNDDFDTITDSAFWTASCRFWIWIVSYFGWFGSNAT